MKNYYLFIFVLTIFGIFIIGMVSAEPSYWFKQGDPIDLKISCFDINNTICLPSTSCQISILYSNQTDLIKNASMSYDDNYFKYSLNENQTDVNGIYTTTVTCQGSNSGFTSYSYEINPTGIKPSEQRSTAISRSIYIIFGVAILFFIAFLIYSSNMSIKLSFGILSFTLFLIALDVMVISLQDAVVNPKLETFFSSFVAISFYMYWFAGGMLLIVWTLTFFNTWFLKKNEEAIRRYGQ